MLLYILNRLGQTMVTLVFLSLVIFGLARLSGDPTPLIVPAEATQADRDFFRRQYGLDRSLPEQYVVFVRNVLNGDFGVSFRFRRPAIELVANALGPTLKLTTLAMAIAIGIGVPLGILGAVSRHPAVGRLVTLYAGLGQAIPSFWLGLVLILVFAVQLGLLPSSGYGTKLNYVLPALTLSIYTSASVTLLAEANVREALRSDFVRMERILGLPERLIVLKHALRNASLPIVTYLGLQFGLLFGGAIVTERVFAWPGIGQTVVDAILGRDYPVVQATILVTACLFMLLNTAVDILCHLLDPRTQGGR